MTKTVSLSSLPIVYSCSGCSNLAQMANQLAVSLNSEKKAEMSCIAGVGGNVKSLVKIAQSGRPILAIDGCHLSCTKQCLAQHDIQPSKHLILSELGFKKKYHQQVSQDDVQETLITVRVLIDEIR